MWRMVWKSAKPTMCAKAPMIGCSCVMGWPASPRGVRVATLALFLLAENHHARWPMKVRCEGERRGALRNGYEISFPRYIQQGPEHPCDSFGSPLTPPLRLLQSPARFPADFPKKTLNSTI